MKCTTFQSLLKPLTHQIIKNSINHFDADRYCKTFKTQEHLLALIYAQIHKINSLRELEISFNSTSLVKGNKIKRSTLSDANERRPAECFLWIAQHLMSALPRKGRKELKAVISILDSSPIQLSGQGYEWAKENRTICQQGLKLHVEYDLAFHMPVEVKISHPNCNDCTMGQKWPTKTGIVYVFDKGYYDFNWWWSLTQKEAYFVTRLKKNAAIETVKKNEVKEDIILEDNLIKLKNKHPGGGRRNLYTALLRRIVVKREGKETPLTLITNMLTSDATYIASLYKARWKIELFFKWLKQHLKIKKFLGKSENAVKIQLAVAIITYLLIGIFRNLFKKTISFQHTLIWVRHNLFRKKYYKDKPPPLCFTNGGYL